MRRLALAALVLLATPAHPDAACHHYSVWHFPFPQRCNLVAEKPRHVVGMVTPKPAPPLPLLALVQEPDIPLPPLALVDWGGCPDNLRERLINKGAMMRSVWKGEQTE
jgi:hypothetical protein